MTRGAGIESVMNQTVGNYRTNRRRVCNDRQPRKKSAQTNGTRRGRTLSHIRPGACPWISNWWILRESAVVLFGMPSFTARRDS